MIDPLDDLHARLDAIQPSIQPYSIEWSETGRPDVKFEAQPSALQLSAVHDSHCDVVEPRGRRGSSDSRFSR